MSTVNVEYGTVINARPEDVYAVFRDYRVSHPAVLPKPYFEYLTVEAGGLGAGTKFTAGMNIFGTKSTFSATVSEPEPGHIILEKDDEERIVTYFIMDPVENGTKTLVTLRTKAKTSGGFQGIIERLTMPSILRMIYKKELANVAAYVAKQAVK
jgi:hypothetical protein